VSSGKSLRSFAACETFAMTAGPFIAVETAAVMAISLPVARAAVKGRIKQSIFGAAGSARQILARAGPV
jgi:hypothetical protein